LLRIRTKVEVIQNASPERTIACLECSRSWLDGVDHPVGTIYCSPRCRTQGWRRRRSGENGVTVTPFLSDR
jgi:hypothetical protein